MYVGMLQIVTIRLSYKLQWPEQRLVVNESADWGVQGEINISPDNIEVRANILHSVQDNGIVLNLRAFWSKLAKSPE